VSARARVRRVVRGAPLGVDVRASLNLVGLVIKYLSAAPLLPAAVAIGYSEPVWPFLAAAAIGIAFGWTLQATTSGRRGVGAREAFLVVSLTWLLAAGLGALPYLLSDNRDLSAPLDGYFEAMSGFTTTGATVLTDFDALSRSLAMWRQFTQWLGGMGIIVLALAVLPRLHVGGRQLFEHELPGPEIEPLAASIRDTARRFWVLYIALTAAAALSLAIVGWAGLDDRMGLFEAVGHAFTTMPTGGFSTEGRSIEAFAAASQWVIVVFMIIAGANFALTYRALVRRQPGVLLRDEELRLYLALLALGAAALLVEVTTEELVAGGDAVRHAVFQTVSMMTTTGYASADFNEWTLFTAVVLVGLMLVGGCAGSTSGSVKVVRHLLIGRILRRELDQTVHPELVALTRLNRVPVDERALRAILAFVLLYVGIFALGTLALLTDASFNGPDIRAIDAIAASATTLGNVGPALGFAGPMGSFEPFSDVSKTVMIALMWLGRLEIVPVVVLLTRSYWRT
jgi:trk system potassium uptake protein TrkH